MKVVYHSRFWEQAGEGGVGTRIVCPHMPPLILPFSPCYTLFVINTRIVINKYIVADPDICHGKPTFKGTRIMVWQVLEMLAEGESFESIRNAFLTPLTREQIAAALDYASTLTRNNYVVVDTNPIPA